MSQPSSESIHRAVVIVIASMSMVLGTVIALCAGVGGLSEAVGVFLHHHNLRVMSALSVVVQIIRVAGGVVVVGSAVVAMVKPSVGRRLLIAALLLGMSAEVLGWGSDIALGAYFLSQALTAVAIGGVMGLGWLMVKCLAYLMLAAVLFFLGPEG